jgi:hypothetical protein
VEAAWYAPREGDAIPPLAVALGAGPRAAVAEGAARYIEALQERWPIVTRRTVSAGGDGQCLDGLRTMPGFAPCWVATDEGVVLAWNETTLRRALTSGLGEGPEDRAIVRLDRFAEADRVLRRARSLDVDPAIPYPWRSLELEAVRAPGLRLRGSLHPSPEAGP